MPRDPGPRVAIVGGGIGGLTASLFLRRAGVSRVTVYEQASRLAEIGAGIQLAPNAVRLLRRLGLAERLASVAVRLEVGWEFRRWEDASVLSVQRLGDECERRFGAPYYVTHRADVLDLLRDAVPPESVRLGHRCVGAEQDGDTVELRFANGERARADVAIGADGIHSVLHGSILPPQQPEFSGLAAYRCLVPAERAPELARRPVCTLWLGPGRHFVHYPVSGGRLVNVVTANPAHGWTTESWTAEGRVEDLAAEFAGWHDAIHELIAGAATTRQYAFYAREPIDRWTLGRIALLGDAAHPMMPFLAQGASQAIEDGAVLAGCLADAGRDEVEGALRRYEALRRDRASRIQRMSGARRAHHHLPDGEAQRARDAEMADEDPLAHNAWIYGHDAEADVRVGSVVR